MSQVDTPKLILPNYESLSRILFELGVHDEPARVHGLLCGLIVSTGGVEVSDWLKSLGPAALKWHAIEESSRELLSDLLETTLAQFCDPEMQFFLLLPHDEETMEYRVRAFGLWCEGFTQGLATQGDFFALSDSPEFKEMIDDIYSMTSVDDDVKEDEEQEKAFFELLEYVKVAVLFLQEEFSSARETGKKVAEVIH